MTADWAPVFYQPWYQPRPWSHRGMSSPCSSGWGGWKRSASDIPSIVRSPAAASGLQDYNSTEHTSLRTSAFKRGGRNREKTTVQFRQKAKKSTNISSRLTTSWTFKLIIGLVCQCWCKMLLCFRIIFIAGHREFSVFEKYSETQTHHANIAANVIHKSHHLTFVSDYSTLGFGFFNFQVLEGRSRE